MNKMKVYIQKLKSAVKKVPLFLAMVVTLLCSVTSTAHAAEIGENWVYLCNVCQGEPVEFDSYGVKLYGTGQVQVSVNVDDASGFYMVWNDDVYPLTYKSDDGGVTFYLYTNTSGIRSFYFQTDMGKLNISGDLADVSAEIALYADMTPEPPVADNETFLDHATNTLNWFITTMGTLLGFLLKNPICFIGLIATIVIAAVGTTRHVTGG